MGTRQARAHYSHLEEVRRRFERWRRTRKVLSRIPEPLWAAAVEAAGLRGFLIPPRHCGSTSTCRRNGSPKLLPLRFILMEAPSPRFLNLPLRRGLALANARWSWKMAPAKMRVHLQSAEAPDLAAPEPELLGTPVMIQITPQMRIMVAIEPCDFRKGIDGLARVCKEVLKQDPFSGWVFVFRNRPATALKALIYDGQGFWLCHKRLSTGRFCWWPTAAHAAAKTLAAHQLHVLLSAGNPKRCKQRLCGGR